MDKNIKVLRNANGWQGTGLLTVPTTNKILHKLDLDLLPPEGETGEGRQHPQHLAVAKLLHLFPGHSIFSTPF